MKCKIVSILILASLCFTGCKNDDDVVDQKRVPKSIAGANTTINFQYNANNQLVKVTDKTNDSDYSEMLFTYNTGGKLSKFVNASYLNGSVSTHTYTVEYLENNLVRVKDEDNEYVLVTLNEKGQALEFKGMDGSSIFSYDGKGNMVKMTSNAVTITASYNNDKGVVSAINTPSWVFMLTDLDLHYYAVNNPVLINEVYQGNETAETHAQIISYPREHIILGYPTRMNVTTNQDGQSMSEVFNITY